VEEKMGSIKKEDVITEKTDEICELCGNPMQVKFGRYGKFLSCTNFPECKNAKPMGEEAKKEEIPAEEMKELQKKFADKKCKKCGKEMVIKSGRFGEYLACVDYPTCKTTESILKSIGVKCPQCNEGELVERRTKRGGKPFYGCNRFPKCKFAVWEKPSSSEQAMEFHKASVEKSKDKKKKEE
jgi:DNA topoisomerase-1